MRFRPSAVSVLTTGCAAVVLSLGVSTALAQDVEEPPVVHEFCYEQSTAYPVPAALVRDEIPDGFRALPASAVFGGAEVPGDETAVLVAFATDCTTAGVRPARSLYFGVPVDPPADLELANQQHVQLLRGYTDHAKFARHASRWCFGHVLAEGTVQHSVTMLPGARVGTVRARNASGSVAIDTNIPDPGTANPSPPAGTIRFFAARDGQLVGIMDAATTPAVFLRGGTATLTMSGSPFELSEPGALAGASLHIFPGPGEATNSLSFSSQTRCH